jgi:hypothetical protein
MKARVIHLTKAQCEGKEPLPPLPGRRQSIDAHYYPKTPLQIVLAVVAKEAQFALPLVLAAHRQMHMREVRSIALTKSIWRAAGLSDNNHARHRRSVALNHLRKIPDVLTLTLKRSRSARYQVAYGPLWKQRPRIHIEDEKAENTARSEP